jgi:D-sedoheptulose 7-phosphate isomerase
MAGERIVTTNGCFDGLHPGHVRFLAAARALGDALLVGINTDESVRRLKGPDRPRFTVAERREMLLALRSVDDVIPFDEPTPVAWLERVRPHVHCKGGDWQIAQMPEASVVERHGGTGVILPRIDGHSSTRTHALADPIERVLRDGAALLDRIEVAPIRRAAEALGRILAAGGRIWACGNGGSAADAQHLAAELVGRFADERRPLPAASLAADASVLTALANDFGFEHVFSRQVEALVRRGDALVAISTSGRSANVCRAVDAARLLGAFTVAVTGAEGLATASDLEIRVPARESPLAQQGHRAVLHALASAVERFA